MTWLDRNRAIRTGEHDACRQVQDRTPALTGIAARPRYVAIPGSIAPRMDALGRGWGDQHAGADGGNMEHHHA